MAHSMGGLLAQLPPAPRGSHTGILRSVETAVLPNEMLEHAAG
jgi:hypothetical protein